MTKLMTRVGLGIGAAVLTITGSTASAGATGPDHGDGPAIGVSEDDSRTASTGVALYALGVWLQKAMVCPLGGPMSDCAYPRPPQG